MARVPDHLPVIGITMGDPVGIGPEIIVKALGDHSLRASCIPVVIGDRTVLSREARIINAPFTFQSVVSLDAIPGNHDTVPLIEASLLNENDVVYGHPTAATGKALAHYIIKAVGLARDGFIDAVVTAPINKQSLHDAGYNFPGHTEMLAQLTGTKHVVMMLAGPRLRVVLVTIHCALSRVPQLLTIETILRTIRITNADLSSRFGLERPRIAVAGLNPHAGEAGMFGQEEDSMILPAIRLAQSDGIAASGPYPPDTIFHRAVRGDFDVVVCMYHDQGLIPLKLLHFDDGVNITLGLPIIRTSVDHGTAYDIAGKGVANPASLVQAIRTAAAMVNKARNLKTQKP